MPTSNQVIDPQGIQLLAESVKVVKKHACLQLQLVVTVVGARHGYETEVVTTFEYLVSGK